MLFLRKNKYFNRIISYIINRTYTSSKRIKKYKAAGLILFIGIPLPFTGVWTGALAVYLLSISKSYTVSGIVFGVIMSGIIVTFISLTGLALGKIFLAI